MPSSPKETADSRFAVSRATLLTDRFMNFFIRVGGVGIIGAVLGILVFIVAQVLPLFKGAEVTPLPPVALGAPADAVVGLDEYGERPFYATAGGDIVVRDAVGDGVERLKAPLPEDFKPALFTYNERLQRLAYVSADSSVVSVNVGYGLSYDKDGKRRVVVSPKAERAIELPGEGPVRELRFEEGPRSQLFVTVRGASDAPGRVSAVRVKQKRGLDGRMRSTVGDEEPLEAPGMGEPARVLVSSEADGVVVADRNGEVFWFHDEGEGFALAQRFKPFDGGAIAQMGFIFGDVSLSFSDATGRNIIWSLHQVTPEGASESRRLWGRTKTLASTAFAPGAFARCFSNKCYLLAGEGGASLRHATSENVRADIPLDFAVRRAGLGSHYDLAWFLDGKGDLRRFKLEDPHPEAGWNAFFGKVWYEGAEAPAYSWQSTSGNDDFEPKLSLVPLLFGTIKGTFYALIFAVPVALLAALYTSQFMKPEVRRVVKPAIELMASLPSVVLGFLAALWLAPRIEFNVPGMLLACVTLPVVAMVFGGVWARLPKRVRVLVGAGNEFVALVPISLLAMWLAWQCGPVLERVAFAGDFPAWWRSHAAAYEQRNCLIIGFTMGFAVIPIIYTIAEDSLSNVPKSLVSASLALGASRWQTARSVVLPTASAGIFSALMIGFGRAVGETMIVVMATGNTPVIEWNVFSGMRTASANIAVELPEAAVGSTHYRTLFLCACCLFLLTFLLNTVAEVLRHRLRERYKVV